MAPIIVTPGDPNGIGFDTVIQAHALHPEFNILVIADKHALNNRAKQLGINIDSLNIQHLPLENNVANYILKTLDVAVDSCLKRQFHAMVTGPINKSMMNDAGIPFTGHTEYLAQRTNTKKTVMSFITPGLRIALATTHLPLASVPAAITKNLIEEVITIINDDLKKRFSIQAPRIRVCGLNPHAGENGHLGQEEIKVISPAIKALKEKGIHVEGPVSADTAFTKELSEQSDIILAMYHDQALPVIKAQYFYEAVNVTLGLPIIRTSVDHGTAYELAGTGKSNPTSLITAIKLAQELN